MKKIVSLFLAFLVLSMTLLAVGCSKDKTSSGIPIVKDKNFNYNTTDLSEYVNLSLSDITGLDIDVSGEYLPIDRAAVESEIRYMRLFSANCQTGREDVYSFAPEWGDQVYVYYDLTKTVGGESIGSNLYSTEGRQTVKIGFYEFSDRMLSFHPLFDNAQLSEALLHITPSARRTRGAISEGDSLRVSYTAKFEDGSVYMTGSYFRIDTHNIMSDDSIYAERFGMDFVEALFEHDIGESYTLETFLDVSEASGAVTSKKVSYEVKVEYVVEESFTTVAIDLPADAFDDTYSEQLRSLNGTRVYLSVSVDGYADYSVPEFDVNFITQELGLFIKEGETVDAFYERAYETKRRLMEEERKKVIAEEMLSVLANTVFTQDRIKQIPADPYYEHIDVILTTVENAYNVAKRNAEAEGKAFNYASLEDYAKDYLQYTSEEFASLQVYAEQVALETVTDRLFIFRVLELADLRLSIEELRKEHDDYLARLKSLYPDYTEDEILQKFEVDGGFYWYVNFTIAYGYFTDYVYNNNSYH